MIYKKETSIIIENSFSWFSSDSNEASLALSLYVLSLIVPFILDGSTLMEEEYPAHCLVKLWESDAKDKQSLQIYFVIL